MEPLVNRPGLMGTDAGSQLRATPVIPKFSFDAIKVADLAQEPAGHQRVLRTRLIKLPTRMRPARGQCDALLAPGKAPVCSVPIALHRSPEVHGQHFVEAGCRPAGFPLVNGISSRT